MSTLQNLLNGTAITRQGPDSGTGPITETAEPERKKIADRDWINDAGEVVDEENATGIRYRFLGRAAKPEKGLPEAPAESEAATFYFRDMPPAMLNMLAGFGGQTLMGNVTNTWLGNKGEDREATAKEAIEARFALLRDGKWIDRTAGGVGSRLDKAQLIEALVLASVDAKKFSAPDSQEAQDWRAKWTQAAEEKPELLKQWRSVPSVAAHYTRLVGKSTKTVEDLFQV